MTATENQTEEYRQHMEMPWEQFVQSNDDVPAKKAALIERTVTVGRIGLMILACGTGSWRVRDAMNIVARSLGLTCTADIGLMTIEYTCVEGAHSYTQVLSLPSSGVNMTRLNRLEGLVKEIELSNRQWTVPEIHDCLSQIEKEKSSYTAIHQGLAAGLACAAFVFLLGGGPIEMLCSFIGAGIGNFIRRQLIARKMMLLVCVSIAVAVACLCYAGAFYLIHALFQVSGRHEAGYIGAMLFIIPGFPFITSGLDMSKLDMRSGLERLSYAILIILVGTLVGWLMAVIVGLKPENFIAITMSPALLMILRLICSFFGVFGFSIMFNSSVRMASVAGLIGAIANTLRLTLVDHQILAGAAAFLGALTAGLLASIIRRRVGYPRISITIPSIVIMVPGLYLYRAVYNFGMMNVGTSAEWMMKAIQVMVFLPLGLTAARVLTDPKWRHTN